MTDRERERENRELRQKLEQLEARVEQLGRASRRGRSAWVNALLAFVIVLIVTLVGIGVLQYIGAP